MNLKPNHLHFIDLLVVAVYLLVTIIYGCYFTYKSRTPTQFTTAGGKLSGWIVGLSIFGTYVSSISFLANPGSSFATNWNGYVFNISCVFAAIIAIKYFVPYYRKHNAVSAYELLETRFGLWARIYTSICFILTAIARMAVILYLVALPIHQITGWNVIDIILITGAITVIYTLLGGVEGVIYTIALQSLILIVGAIICIILIPYHMPGGVSAIFHIAWQQHKFSLGSLSPNLMHTTFWVVLLFGLTNNLQNLGIDQNYVQRYITANSEHEAKKSVWISTLLFLFISMFFFFIGTALYALYTTQPQLLTPQIQASIASGSGDQVFPFFIVNNLPYGLAGLVTAAIIAAAMSTISSNLNSTATLVYEDYFKRFCKREFNNKTAMRVLYSGSLIMGIIMILAAITMIHVKSALILNWILASVFGGGILGLFLLSISRFKINTTAAITAVIVGVITILYLTLLSPLNHLLTLVIGTAIILIVGFLLTFIFTSKKAQQ